MNTWTVLKSLPKIHHRRECYTSLKDECIGIKDYLTFINLWNKFKINS